MKPQIHHKTYPGFPDPLQLENAGMRGGSRVFVLLADYRAENQDGTFQTIKAGRFTDGASIPQIFWNILGPFGPYFPAAVRHDENYSPTGPDITRKQADLLLLKDMERLGVKWITRQTIYAGVRVGGWRHFKKEPLPIE